ncbi:unnamed protein product [Blepharisma stoltei]|uniref:Uncharacterized protein n=1 Tax=Blepharisma stoltei TaxID=1481888 RepID=A0AAU9K8G6_9CILI|nr:unnamed protein product [Blepharisma stoltei]
MNETSPNTSRIQNCILNDESLDLVTELDHLNHQCICSLCTCGKHICPAKRLKLYPKGTFTSLYKQDFKYPASLSPPKRIISTYRPGIHKMDDKTSNEIDFKPYDLSKTSRTPEKPNFSTSLRFLGKSKYKTDFPNWGQIQAEKEISPKESTLINRKFEGESIYSQSYIRKNLTPDLMRKVLPSTSIPSIYKYDRLFESTNKREFNLKANRYNTPSPNYSHSPITPTYFNPSQYISVSKQAFTGPNSPLKDPRLIRKQKLVN